MFFGDAFAGSFFNLFATHPPLEQRIRALDPAFDGTFPEVQPVAADIVPGDAASHLSQGVAQEESGAMGLDAGKMVRHIGQPQAEHLHQASQTIGQMPRPLLDAVREPFSAQAVIFALLLSRDEEATRAKQWQLLQRQVGAPLYQEVQRLAPAALSLPAADRLPAVNLTTSAIKRSSPQQYAEFRQVVEALVAADGKVDLFEYCLRTVLFGYLDVFFGLKKPPAVRWRTTAAVAQPLTVVLSTLAHAGQNQPEDIQRAFQAGVQGRLEPAALLPKEHCTLGEFDAALSSLAQGSPTVKRDVIAAVTACIAADGRVTLEESELLRAVAAVLGCPVPPSLAAVS